MHWDNTTLFSDDDPSDAAFRREVRDWVRSHCPRKLGHRAAELLIHAAGPLGPLQDGFLAEDGSFDLAGELFASRISVVGGGTTEIQRNIIARRLLELPS